MHKKKIINEEMGSHKKGSHTLPGHGVLVILSWEAPEPGLDYSAQFWRTSPHPLDLWF